MEDFAALLESHDCSAGLCSRRAHIQVVSISPEDVATTADEIRTLVDVRDRLTERGFTMLETDPTPRFDVTDNDKPAPWAVKYVASLPGTDRTETTGRRRGLFRLFGLRG